MHSVVELLFLLSRNPTLVAENSIEAKTHHEYLQAGVERSLTPMFVRSNPCCVCNIFPLRPRFDRQVVLFVTELRIA